MTGGTHADRLVPEAVPSGPARPLIALVTGYRRFISPFLGPRCRFYPSCSAYAVEALRVHGALRGLGLTGWRLLRCQPFHPGGVDKVPPRRTRSGAAGSTTAGSTTAGSTNAKTDLARSGETEHSCT